MRALVYNGPQNLGFEERPKPILKESTDAIVRVLHTSICGTDLHILKGDVATVDPGRILGHEGVGMVESIGSAVSGLQPGDKVLISCVSACGVCGPCRKGLCSHCTYGGWILGNTIDGTQAEYVRIPHATSSLYKLSPKIDVRTAVVLSDSFPTALECGTLSSHVQPGNTVVIIGAGPVGIAALMTAKMYSPSLIAMVDTNDARLEKARSLGADETVNSAQTDAKAALISMTEGRGFDSVMEAVGIPATFELCQEIIAVGGSIANLGVHGKPVNLHLERLWDRNISMSLTRAFIARY
ncbi:chaperonin 10-like protein [Aspergillus ambiguus]|uniref:zinc-dependent alcohol dehydrogenase family protein n=1 Tax=Aspergillus ambiguus TaxID=176160 RepID=UPI003CCCD1EA